MRTDYPGSMEFVATTRCSLPLRCFGARVYARKYVQLILRERPVEQTAIILLPESVSGRPNRYQAASETVYLPILLLS